jgi:hypothetical protein
MRMRRLSLVVIVGLMFALALQAAPASAWSGTVSFGPPVVYQGAYLTFSLTLDNNGGSALDVNWIFVHFCWNPSGYGIYFKDDDGSTVTISNGWSHTFTATTTVAQNALGECVLSIDVNGQAVWDSLPSTRNYSAVIEVMQQMTTGGTSFTWFGMAIVAVIIVVVIIVVVLVVVLSSQHKPRSPPQWPQQPPYIRY